MQAGWRCKRGPRSSHVVELLALFVLAACTTAKLVPLASGRPDLAEKLRGEWKGVWYADNRTSGRFELRITSVEGGSVWGNGTWYDTEVGTTSFTFSGELKDGGLWIPREPNRWFNLKLYELEGGKYELRGRYSTVGRSAVYEGDISVSKK
jgi:hypothetical protein